MANGKQQFLTAARKHRAASAGVSTIESEALVALATWADEETQVSVAQSLGVHASYLNDVLRGRRELGALLRRVNANG